MKHEFRATQTQKFTGHRLGVTALAISPDGKYLLAGSVDGSARIWDALNGVELLRLGRTSWFGAQAVTAAAFSANANKVLTATRPGRVRVSDFDTGEQLLAFRHRNRIVWTNPCPFQCFPAAFSADGRCILTGSMDGTARIWDAENGDELRRIKTGSHGVTAARFSTSGNSILIGTIRGGVSLWDTATGKEIQRFQEPGFAGLGAVYSVEISPDGRLVLAASSWEYVQLWNTTTGKELASLGNDGLSMVQSATFSPDSQMVAVGYLGTTVRLWDVNDGSELATIDCKLGRRIPKAFMPVVFSPSGDYLVTGSASSSALRFDLSFSNSADSNAAAKSLI